jgi:hypothetical protein
MRGSIFKITTFIESIYTWKEKAKQQSQSEKASSHMHVELPPLVSDEATGVCIPIGNQEILLAAVCKSPGRTWNDVPVWRRVRILPP